MCRRESGARDPVRGRFHRVARDAHVLATGNERPGDVSRVHVRCGAKGAPGHRPARTERHTKARLDTVRLRRTDVRLVRVGGAVRIRQTQDAEAIGVAQREDTGVVTDAVRVRPSQARLRRPATSVMYLGIRALCRRLGQHVLQDLGAIRLTHPAIPLATAAERVRGSKTEQREFVLHVARRVRWIVVGKRAAQPRRALFDTQPWDDSPL